MYDAGTDNVGACNVYNDPQAAGGAFELARSSTPTTFFGCAQVGGAPKIDCKWPAQNRKSVQQKPGTGTGHAATTPDYVGIYVKALHRYYTGLFGSAVTITDQSIGKIEPETFTTL